MTSYTICYGHWVLHRVILDTRQGVRVATGHWVLCLVLYSRKRVRFVTGIVFYVSLVFFVISQDTKPIVTFRTFYLVCDITRRRTHYQQQIVSLVSYVIVVVARVLCVTKTKNPRSVTTRTCCVVCDSQNRNRTNPLCVWCVILQAQNPTPAARNKPISLCIIFRHRY